MLTVYIFYFKFKAVITL